MCSSDLFDIEEYINDQRKSRIPESPTYFIDIYHKQAPRPIRDILDFHRVSVENTVKTDVETVDMQKTVAKLRKTKILLLTMLLLCAITVFALVFGYTSQKTAAARASLEAEKAKKNLAEASNEIRKLQKTTYGKISISRKAVQPKGEIPLDFPNRYGAVSENNPLPEWMMTISDPSTQKISVEKVENQNVLRISSAGDGEISLSSKAVPAYPGMRFNVTGFMMSENFSSGHFEMLMELLLPDGTRKTICLSTVDKLRGFSKWKKVSMTITVSKPIQDQGNILLTLRGQFKGDVLLRNFLIKRVD